MCSHYWIDFKSLVADTDKLLGAMRLEPIDWLKTPYCSELNLPREGKCVGCSSNVNNACFTFNQSFNYFYLGLFKQEKYYLFQFYKRIDYIIYQYFAEVKNSKNLYF